MEKISNYQLFSLMLLHQIGTTIIFGFAGGAGRDAWFAVLVSMCIGIGIVVFNMALMRLHPGLTLVEWFPKQLGRWLGTPLAWVYPISFIYIAGRIIADIKFLIPETLLPRTPSLLLVLLFLSLIAYALYQGLEVIGRLAGLLLAAIILLFVIETVLIIIGGNYEVGYLLPFTEEGWGPIFHAVWPTGVTQTFGEIITFAMIWPLAQKQNSVWKVTLASTILTGLYLMLANMLAIITLGPVIFERAFFPMYMLLRQIGIGEFMQNLDVIAVIYFTVTAFFKISIYMFGAIRSIQILALMKSGRPLVLPVSAAVVGVGMTMADNITEHIMGVHMQILSPYLWIHLDFVLPGLLLAVALVRHYSFTPRSRN